MGQTCLFFVLYLLDHLFLPVTVTDIVFFPQLLSQRIIFYLYFGFLTLD